MHQIDQILGHPLSWNKRLEEVNHILLEALELDAIWLLTLKPLPPAACGSINTPLVINPRAKVHLVDKAPPVSDNWPAPHSLLGRAIADKKPHFIQSTGTANSQVDFDLGDALFGTFSLTPAAIIPLVAEHVAVGALVVASRVLAKAPPSDNMQDMLWYLGKHLGTNLQNAYLVDRSRLHADALRTLNQIAQTITSSLDIDEVLHRTMAGINQILDVEAGSLLLLDEQTGELYFKITLRGENKRITSFRLQPGQGIAGWVVANNKPVISNNAREDERFYHKIDQAIGFSTLTVLCVPLLIKGNPIGALEVINKRSGPFSEDDQELLISMAASLGIALENVHLHKDTQERAHQIEIINQIAATVNTGHGLTETAKIILEQFSQLLSFDHLSISLLEDSKESIRQWLFTEYGCFEHTKSSIPLEKSALAWIIENNRGRIYQDISSSGMASNIFPDDQILLDDGVKSKIAIPLTTPKGPYGSLNIGRRQANAYGLKDLELLLRLTPQVAVAIEKARLMDAMEQRATQLKRLNHLGEMLVSTIDLELIVDTTLSMIPRLLPGDVQGIIVAGEQGAYLGVAVPFDFAKTDEVVGNIFNTFAEMSEGEVSAELVYSKSIAGHMPVSTDWEAVSTLSFPILTRFGLLGIIYMASHQKEELGDDLLHIFSLIVSQISAVLENAHLFQQVEQERARLAAILSSSTDAILVVNRRGRIVLDNPAARTVMGVTESQSGRLLAESTENKELVQLFENAGQGGKTTGEIPLTDGRTYFANLSPVAADEVSVTGWVATMQDISYFKELNQLKNEFVNTVSHDLRSPLSSILIASNLMSDVGPTNEVQKELLETIERRVGTMKRLIDDLLDVGRIEAGIDMEMAPCTLAPLIDEVTSSFLHQAEDKAIQLTCELTADLPPILANSARLHQVFNNLVGNAIKYTPRDGQVTVKVFQQDDDIRVQVIDTGPGIPAADQPHIFEKFYRVRGEQVESIKGTGLGLAITKSIVEKHRGRIWLDSVFGNGSTFNVALPVHNHQNP